MTPLADAIVREVLRELEASDLLAHLSHTQQAEVQAELWSILLVRVERLLSRARLGVPDD